MKVANDAKFTSDELLQFLAESGQVNITETAKQLRMKKKEKILEQHPFKITQGNDGRWKTRVLKPDGKRKLIAKTSKEDLLDALLDFYELTPVDALSGYTLTSLFNSWCEFKELHNAAPTYIKRIKKDWKNYYQGKEIALKPINEITLYDCDIFAHKLIKKVNGSKKQYYNISMIIRQILDYAVEMEILDTNVFSKLKIKSKMVFTPKKKKDSETQVFSQNEVYEITKLAWQEFEEGHNLVHKLIPLAILFQFQTGVRVGELCALRYEDIKDKIIQVQRMYRYETKEIVEFTKGHHEDRLVPLTSEAKFLIEKAKEYQEENNMPSNGYIFSVNDEPLSYYAIKKQYARYSKKICGIVKSSHKVRKTYISSLIDAGVNLDRIREIVGHADEQTTLNSYCFDRLNLDENISLIEKALSDKKKK